MLHLGSIRGTSIDVDFSFIILVIFFVAMNYDEKAGIQYALIWIPILFLSVLIHELAHAAMIGIFGFGSSQIVLGGMGGVTMNQRRAKPWQDMLISLAGPLSSFAIMYLSQLAVMHLAIVRTDPMLAALVPRLYWANRFWGLFNLIPVPPLDGGHAVREFFRTILAERPAFVVSIWIAIVAGGAIAVWMFVGGQFFIALFIAWFVYVAFQKWLQFRESGVPGD